MQTGVSVALSAQVALEKRLATLAQNVANANTAGYRADVLDFKSVLSKAGSYGTDFVVSGGNHIDPNNGGLRQTNNALDVAVKGEGFLGYQPASGPAVYSRDGRLTLAGDGRLINGHGDALLDAGGAPLQLDANNPNITIANDGTITQGGKAVGRVGLYQLKLDAGFQRAEGSAFIPKEPVQTMPASAKNGLLQGYYEDSNVNPAIAMAGLMQLSRAFESVTQLAERSEDQMKNAIEVLSSHG